VEIPAGVEQDRSSRHVVGLDLGDIHRPLASTAEVYRDRLDIHQAIQVQIGQIGALFISVERAVEVRSGVTDHRDMADFGR
jgi:hypothetical protein